MKISELINLEAQARLKRLRWSVYIRYLVLCVVAILVLVGDRLGADYGIEGVIAATLLGLLYNSISSFLYHRARYPAFWPYFGIVLDMAVITLIVHYTGGIESIFIVLYLLQIVGTNVHFSRLAGPLNFIVGGVAFVALIILEGSGTIEHLTPLLAFEGAYQNPTYILIVSLSILSLMGISAYRSGYVIQSLQTVEHELTGMNDQLLQANQALQLANRRLKELDRMKTEFISVASHQLRTPLSAVKWVLKMILDEDLGSISSEQREMLAKGYESNERMIALINDLLNVSRIEEGRFEYHFTPSALLPVLEQVVGEIRPAIERKKLAFEFVRSPKPLPILSIDDDKLQLALENILDNAVKYTPEGGRASLRVRVSGREVVIEIEDGGVGIPAGQQEQVFNKFFRGDNVVRMQTSGTGLGLFIARKIVEAHQGRVSFSSREGVGTTFAITLPVPPPPGTLAGRFETFMKSI